MKAFFHNVAWLCSPRKNIISRFFLFMIAVMTCLLLIIMSIWSINMEHTVSDLSLSHVTDITQNANNQFQENVRSLIANMDYLNARQEVMDFLSPNASPDSALTLKLFLHDTCNMLLQNVRGIAIASEYTGKIVSSGSTWFSPDFQSQSWYRQTLQSGNKVIYVNRFSENEAIPKNSFSMCMPVRRDGRSVGAIIFDIDSALITNCFGSKNMNGVMRTLILNDDNTILFANSRDLSPESVRTLAAHFSENADSGNFCGITLDGEEYLALSRRFSIYSDWQNITFAPKSALQGSYRRFFQTAVLCILTAIGIMLMFSLFISNRLSKSFRTLTDYISRIDLSAPPTDAICPDTFVTSDIRDIYAKLSRMTYKISNQLDTITQLEENKRILEIEALRTQVNPHLVYNTLNAIHTLAELNGIQSIRNMSSSLIRLLMYSTTDRDKYVPLSRELEHVRDYMEIMQNKFINQIELYPEIEDCVQECLMLKLCLQPIVENSIKHGFSDIPGQYILIKAYESDSDLLIKVSDNGIGILPDILHGLLDDTAEDDSHLGLRNLDKRIRLTFGASYGLKIVSTPKVQTTVIIRIPMLRKEDVPHV